MNDYSCPDALVTLWHVHKNDIVLPAARQPVAQNVDVQEHIEMW